MKNNFLLFLLLFIGFNSIAQYTDRQLIINTTGNGFSRTTFNGVDPGKWEYIQKFANLTYNGQDASVTAVRFHVTWTHYEPTANDYQRTKIVQAIQAITALKPGMKVALHFPYQRDGRIIEQLLPDEDISRTANGTLVAQDIGWAVPSIFSASAKQKFYAFVDDVLAQIAANNLMDKILYVEMGNGSAEEFANPYITINGQLHVGSYEDKAVQAWRTEYLPCRYPGQSTVTWNGNTHNIATAPVATNPYGDWSSEHQKEYHRFIGWGLMKFYKGFRDVVKARNSALKVVYFVSDFGSQQGNQYFLHNSTLPMAMQEFDGIYTSDGTWIYDLDRKIMPVDVIKGTNPNKIAAIEFDQEDLGQANPPSPNSPIDANLTAEWMARAYKHGVNHINLAMWFNDTQIEQLKPIFANLRATYLTPGYTAPARQAATTQNIFPNVFGATGLFNSWNSNGGSNWSVSDNNPVSINMIDDGYWQNIWSCSSNPDPCLFSVSASASNSNPQTNASVTLSSSCTGQCSGVSYSWSGNGISGSGNSISFNAPATAGTYTYTVTASKNGCSNKTATTTLTVTAPGGGENPCSYVDKQTVGTWNGLNVQTRKYTVNGAETWLIVTAVSGSSVDKHFPRGKNFADRTDISWSVTLNKTCLGGGETGWGGLVFPSNITVPSGYTQNTEPDGAVYFQQSGTTPPPQGPNCGTVSGHLDGASCHFIEGWAYDASNPNTVINVDIYSGSTLIAANVPANKFRQDLLNANIGNGVHGLEIATPAALKDGQTHNITVRVSGCSFNLINSPRTITSCSNATLQEPLDGNTYGALNNQLPLTIAPNPSRGVFDARFYMEKGKKGTISVTDLQGRIIYKQSVTGQGMHKERINLSNKASGTLLLQINREDGTNEVKKINIVR